MKNYFENCKNLEELKKEYKKLAMEFHPDRPTGNSEIMKIINNQYEVYFDKLKNVSNTNTSTDTSEVYTDFINVINELINCNGIELEICGTWLWVSGETKPYKDIFKKLGFFWQSKKTMWALKPAGTISHKHKEWNMEEIRNTYGSQKIETHKPYCLV